MPITIDRLDHLVLTVRDLAATVAFYTRVLGMRAETFGDHRTALHFGQHKINLHEAGSEFEPKAERPMPGSADLCFITSTPLTEVVAHLEQQGITVIEGIVERTGALGKIESVYLRDPDGNLIEISGYDSGEAGAP